MKSGALTAMRVAAGMVFRQGRLLITQRLPGDHLGGQWEFPGGKVHPGENLKDCLRRELKEELGIEVQVGEVVEEIEHEYPACRVRLFFFRCRWTANEPRPIGCQALAWVLPENLSQYQFPPADRRMLRRLRVDRRLWSEAD